MEKVPVKIDIRKTSNPNIFEFTIASPVIRTQFRIPRAILNQLRILIEKRLISK
ncbi:hypothetical protein ACFL1I_03080 [Candidatus Omnitrophota bacterium]